MNDQVPNNGYEERRGGIAAFMNAPLYDALSTLIRQLYSRSTMPAARTLILTSPHSRSGVSYLSSCTATLVAEEFGSTILVDGRVIEEFAKAGRLPTRADCSSIKNTRLWVLGSSESARTVSNELSHPLLLGAVVEALVREFDFVIIDAPAMSQSAVAESLSPYVDGSILVVVPNITEIRDIVDARVKLTARGGHVFGAIYNSSHEGPGAERQP